MEGGDALPSIYKGGAVWGVTRTNKINSTLSNMCYFEKKGEGLGAGMARGQSIIGKMGRARGSEGVRAFDPIKSVAQHVGVSKPNSVGQPSPSQQACSTINRYRFMS